MNDGERRMADVRGRFLAAAGAEPPTADREWTEGRILLSNRRIVLADGDGTRTVPLSAVRRIGDADERSAEGVGHVSVRTADGWVLLSTDDPATLERRLHSALLDGAVVLVRPPGVDREDRTDAGWRKARVAVRDGALTATAGDGTVAGVDLDRVRTVRTDRRTVLGRTRPVVEVEHVSEGAALPTSFAADDRRCSSLVALFERFEGDDRDASDPPSDSGADADVPPDLDRTHERVLAALYSGISPFEVPEFVGMDADRVEAIFEDLIERGALDEVRRRREVALTDRGRELASEVIDE